MNGFLSVLAFLAAVALLSAPVALIVSVIALRRVAQLRREMELRSFTRPAMSPVRRAEGPAVVTPQTSATDVAAKAPAPLAKPSAATPPATVPASSVGLEQRIGTRWVLAAGVITVIFAVGFFLKYAYDQQWIGPLGRICIAALAGAMALAGGEFTRRRGYDVVAKGVTALGFAIFYATDFAAHRWYDLIGLAPAFTVAVLLTIGAMAYALVLDEVVAALLALVGGYLAPLILATGANEPNLIFGYIAILSAGAMLCAYWRHWAPVNMLAFAGTVVLYTSWFERFYRPTMSGVSSPPQIGAALFWLTVFFLVFLVLPLLGTLRRRVKATVQDLILILVNAAVMFYYFWTILTEAHHRWLALTSLLLGGAYLLMAVLVRLRCRTDADLRHALLGVALVFVTLAVPLYFEAYAAVMAWAVEGVVLVVVGLYYRSRMIQLAAGLVLALIVGKLLFHLPLHDEPFRVFVNADFGAWLFVVAAVMVCHALYRFNRRLDPDLRDLAAQSLYAISLGLLLAAVTMELWYYDRLMLKGADMTFFVAHMLLVLPAFLLLLLARPVCPRGQMCRFLGAALGGFASFYLILTFPWLNDRNFTDFFNGIFIRGLILVASLFVSSWLLRRSERDQPEGLRRLPGVHALTAVVVLLIFLTEQIWCYGRAVQPGDDWKIVTQTAISITWTLYATALMGVGFWRRIKVLRYLSLTIFVLLLGKVFLIDTRQLASLYRIVGFLATGLALVGVSYLYQYLKKKGFFDRMLAEKDAQA